MSISQLNKEIGREGRLNNSKLNSNGLFTSLTMISPLFISFSYFFSRSLIAPATIFFIKSITQKKSSYFSGFVFNVLSFPECIEVLRDCWSLLDSICNFPLWVFQRSVHNLIQFIDFCFHEMRFTSKWSFDARLSIRIFWSSLSTFSVGGGMRLGSNIFRFLFWF